ncbi:hypothetical protein BJ508DRAFT_140133 [Ascobolus immersus RN42]|uniref:Uncharacterized protein n=1 Tax=Ascobolus immersus RN42 TaxID=1160509 RepID=A0A3N4I4I8_ASCIM|nr:hypothetical protein BJ508DRAFT_140133 [Ascobolus immersus RN42]
MGATDVVAAQVHHCGSLGSNDWSDVPSYFEQTRQQQVIVPRLATSRTPTCQTSTDTANTPALHIYLCWYFEHVLSRLGTAGTEIGYRPDVACLSHQTTHKQFNVKSMYQDLLPGFTDNSFTGGRTTSWIATWPYGGGACGVHLFDAVNTTTLPLQGLYE